MNAASKASSIITLLRGKGGFELVDVRPNPVNDILYFNVAGETGTVNIMLRSITGQQMKKMTLIPGSSSNHFDMSNMSSGIYMLDAVDAAGNRSSFKVIKK